MPRRCGYKMRRSVKRNKKKRAEEWEEAKKKEIDEKKVKNAENRKLVFNRVKVYAKEYDEQEKELIRLKREAKFKGGFYVEPEAKIIFIIRIRGINRMHPRTRKILQLLRLRRKQWQQLDGSWIQGLAELVDIKRSLTFRTFSATCDAM